MASINGVTVIPRHNRPSPVQNTDLRLYFYGDGEQRNPFEVCAVYIFQDTVAATNGDPSKYLDLSAGSTTYGQIASSAVSSAVFIFSAGDNGDPDDSSFDLSTFTDSNIDGSSIYRGKTGELVVVLRPSGQYLNSVGSVVENSASATGRYFDIWLVRDVAGSNLRTYVNRFELFRDNFYSVTSPLQIKLKSRLINKYIEYGSKVDLIFRNDIAILNQDIDESIKNIVRDALVQSASISIHKLNEDQNLSPVYEVSSFVDTGDLTTVTNKDDILFTWDTTDLVDFVSDGNFGSKTGVYQIQLKVNAANQVFYSDKFRLIVR